MEATAPEPVVERIAALEPVVEPLAEPIAEPEPEPEPEPMIAAASEEVPPPLTWEQEISEVEGVVEPVFESDADAVLAELTQHAADLDIREEFPLDAFIVPEQTQHVPSGLEGAAPAAPPDTTPVSSLAERLEKLSHRLRVEETDTVVRRLAGGDRLDALLAGLLAGYLAGKSEQQQQ